MIPNSIKKIFDFFAHHNAPMIALELAIFVGIVLAFAAPDEQLNNETTEQYNPSINSGQAIEQFIKATVDSEQGTVNPENPAKRDNGAGNEQYIFSNASQDYSQVPYSEIRQKIDSRFLSVADELSDAYYNYWKNGLSKPFRGYDVKDTLEESKLQFDKLHGLIWLLYDIEFHNENMKQPSEKRIPEEEYNIEEVEAEDGTLIRIQKTDLTLEKINELKAEGYELNL